ncbi:MAG: glutamate 5-kinase [Candidatus Omnitrophica bacterium COP1]|nr:glutamate 5-kinase [Candidatus Omnitrophica bacterium COP1]
MSDLFMSKTSVKRIVIKVGTALIDSEKDQYDHHVVGNLTESIIRQMQLKREIVLVSSGAVGAGRRRMNWTQDQASLIDRQALAAIGQPRLMGFYNEIFGQSCVPVAQILLTRLGLENRQRYLNARHTIERLLAWGVLPIINENDTVVTEELQFGDNDRLAAVVAGKIHSNLLILLTDVESVWDQENRPVRRVWGVSADLLAAAGGPGSGRSRGGMKSKLRSVQEAMLMGVSAVITSGRIPGIIDQIIEHLPLMSDPNSTPPENLPGTWFISQNGGVDSRKRWILTCGAAKGRILVDEGARQALQRGDRSLLPSGVLRIEGTFHAGEAVSICSLENEPIAQGLANLSSQELEKFHGRSTREIREEIGRPIKTCVAVHHDDMVLITAAGHDIPIQNGD